MEQYPNIAAAGNSSQLGNIFDADVMNAAMHPDQFCYVPGVGRMSKKSYATLMERRRQEGREDESETEEQPAPKQARGRSKTRATGQKKAASRSRSRSRSKSRARSRSRTSRGSATVTPKKTPVGRRRRAPGQ